MLYHYPSNSVCSRGDTGTGKSELFALFSAVINSNCEIVPDLFFAVKQALTAVVLASRDNPAFSGMLEPPPPGSSRVTTFIDQMTGDNHDRLFDLLHHNISWDACPGLVDKVRMSRVVHLTLCVCHDVCPTLSILFHPFS